MSVGITIDVSDSATAALKGMSSKLTERRELNGRLATRVRREVTDNFNRKNSQPNKSGWKPTGYFETLSRRTKIGAVSSDSAEVVISDPDRSLARKISQNPGPITPKESKYLAIPARAEAYGKTPRSFNDLFPIIFRSGAGALVQREQTRVSFGKRPRKDGTRSVTPGAELGGGVFYWLVKSANPPPDPSALPSNEVLQRAVDEEVTDYLEGLTR